MNKKSLKSKYYEENVLMHYASPYYDPVKAHEYYMKNRKLKGRSSSSLNDEGKEIWEYTKNQIKQEKTQENEKLQKERDEKIKALQTSATETKDRISAKLKELNNALSASATAQKEQISNKQSTDIDSADKNAEADKEKIANERDAKIKAIYAEEIPDNLSDEEYQRRINDRAERVAKLRNEADADQAAVDTSNSNKKAEIKNTAASDKQRVSNDTAEEKNRNSTSSAAEREKCSADLKVAITAAREAYKASKTNLDAKYEDIYNQEYEKILSSHKAVKKSGSKKSSSSSGGDKLAPYRIAGWTKKG